jgi:predicted RNA-binding protein associated with RNAse of E/G family
MLKRKFADRSEWKRILDRAYVQTYMDTSDFKGYITLLHLKKVAAPLTVHYGEQNYCIADDGYYWLQHFPDDSKHSVTTMFDNKGEIVQWYIDICLQTGFDQVPWLDDLFLDLIVFPSGKVFQKDIDELDEALNKGVINDHLYNKAWTEANHLLTLLKNKNFPLLSLSVKHKIILEEKMLAV